MKLQILFLGAALLILGWAWAQRLEPEHQMGYRVSFERAAEGVVFVQTEMDVDGDTITLQPWLSESVFGLSQLGAFDEHNRTLPVTYDTHQVGSEKASVRFSKVVIETRGARRITLRYEVAPSAYLPANGDREARQLGSVGEQGCLLSLTNLALFPEDGTTKLHMTTVLPETWTSLVTLPSEVSTADPQELWEAALVAGNYAGQGVQMTDHVRAHLPRDTADELAPTLQSLVRTLESVLGPPREPLEIIVPSLAPSTAPTELPAAARVVVADVRGVDVASLRRFVMRIVPAWWARSVLEIEFDHGPEAWFPLGAREYLAHLIPTRAGLVTRDPAIAIESSWISQPELQSVDLLQESDGSRNSQYGRRLVALTLAQELDRLLVGELCDQLRGYDGSGYPESFVEGTKADLLAAFLATRIEEGNREFSFERAWEIAWDEEPIKRAPQTPIARALTLAFTADTAGFLETCGCKAAQAGGVARRASVLQSWRRDDPNLLLIDLGNFSGAGGHDAEVDPILKEEQDLFDGLLEVSGYDAVVLGPDEFYSARGRAHTHTDREAHTESSDLAWLSGGIQVDGTDIGSNVAIVERAGLEIGIVGFSELLENANMRQAQEAHMTKVAFPKAPAAIEETLRELRPQVDLLVVAGRMRPETLRALSNPNLQVDVVLSALHQAVRETEGGPVGFLDSTLVAFDQLNHFGLQRLTLFLSSDGHVVSARNEPVRLDPNIPDEPEMRARLDDFYASSAVVNLPIVPLFQEDPSHDLDYVGSLICSSCHVAEYNTWQGTKHASAMMTLTAKRRDRSPKCVQCHVVGLGTESGYSLARPDEALGAVGCENCHGAGEQHVLAPSRDNIQLTPDRSTCVTCHNAEHSDAFEERFDEAWRNILHR